MNRYGKTVLTKKVTRAKLRATVANLPPCLVGLEACASSHYWARELGKLRASVKLIAPQFVKPCRSLVSDNPSPSLVPRKWRSSRNSIVDQVFLGIRTTVNENRNKNHTDSWGRF